MNKRERQSLRTRLAWSALSLLLLLCARHAAAQAPSPASLDARVEHLLQSMDETQKQVEASRRQLDQMRQELLSLQQELPVRDGAPPALSSSAPAGAGTAAADQQQMQASQIATLDQIKVESASRYPVRLTGTVLLNGFVNTGRVDQAAAPTTALGGNGSTGLSLRQTVLGFDATGPHLFGASSRADVRADFFGSSEGSNYSSATGLLRLRTAHAALDWKHTELFFALDRPILNPNQPESLVAVAEPELAWSGSLWSWNPQVGLSHTIGTQTRLRLQAAIIDPSDPSTATPVATATQSTQVATLAEQSRRPGAEARIAMLGSDDAESAEIGVGGYYSPHRVATGFSTSQSFDSWAGTLDFRLPLLHRLVLSGSGYRGQGLGGLGGGGYKDYVFRGSGNSLVLRALDDVGGWVQLHQAIGSRLTWNAGFGMDNAFAGQLRAYTGAAASSVYGGIARNRTAFANVIYSPSAYLRLSVEYRNLYTAPAPGPVWRSNITGVGAAYRF